MKNRITFCALLMLSIIMATGCNHNKYNLKLQVTESSWSGWEDDYDAKKVTKVYDVTLGKEYNLNSGKFIFEIKKINKDNIVIKTKEPFSDNEKGIDLNTKKKEFTIYINKEKKLATPTMDSGEVYYLTLYS